MARTSMYSRPNMAALPRDIGNQIIEAIRNTPPIDYEEMHNEAVEWERKAMAMREEQQNGSKLRNNAIRCFLCRAYSS